MKLICLLATLSVSIPAFAVAINPEAEVDSIQGEYVLTKQVEGNCPDKIKLVKYTTLGLGIYSMIHAGEVIVQMSDINRGIKVNAEWNPMTGGLNGWTHEEAKLAAGHFESSHVSRWPMGSLRYSDTIAADYDGVNLKFNREYDGRPFNNICIKQICEYSRAP